MNEKDQYQDPDPKALDTLVDKSSRPPFGGWLDNSLKRIHRHRVLRNHNNKRLKAYLKGSRIFPFRLV